MNPAVRRRIGLGAAAVAAVAIVALAALLALAPPGGEASAPDPEAQALQLERQLLCPKCTNLRLDQCELQVCHDMRREIRDQLAAGANNDDVLLFFSSRFGDRVLADLPHKRLPVGVRHRVVRFDFRFSVDASLKRIQELIGFCCRRIGSQQPLRIHGFLQEPATSEA